LFLCLFFRNFFFRLWVAIFLNLRFLPQGTSASPFLRIDPAAFSPERLAGISSQYETGPKKGQVAAMNNAAGIFSAAARDGPPKTLRLPPVRDILEKYRTRKSKEPLWIL
jgi:hypothetical protein